MSNILSHVNYDGKAIDIIDSTTKPINVLTLGIKNDGVTDCTALINKYTAEFPLFFPAGSYHISNTINVVHSMYGVGYSRNNTTDGTKFWSSSSDNIFMLDLGASVTGNITIENIGLLCQPNNNGINITTHKYIKLSNIGIYSFGNSNEGAWSGTNGYRYGIKMGDTTQGQSRSILADHISIISYPNSPTYGIYADNIYDADISNIEVMFCRHSVALHGGLYKIHEAHLWCGNTDYTNETTEEFNSTRAIILNNCKLQGTDIYTDTAAVAFVLNNSVACISNYTNWFGTAAPATTCEIVYQETPSTIQINNAIVYIPIKFYKTSANWFATQVCISNIRYVVDASPTQYNMLMPKSYDSHFVVPITPNKYTAFLVFQPKNIYGEYVCVRCLLADAYLVDVILKNNSKTLHCTSLSGNETPIYYKKDGNNIILYSHYGNTAECTLLTSSHNCTVYKLSEFINTNNSPYSITQDDVTGLTLIETGKDITIS